MFVALSLVFLALCFLEVVIALAAPVFVALPWYGRALVPVSVYFLILQLLRVLSRQRAVDRGVYRALLVPVRHQHC